MGSRNIPKEVIQSIQSQVNILDVIEPSVELTKRGKNYVGLCPFHDEKTPSFTVEPKKQFYKCFSCGRGGNVFNFVMEKEGLSFPEAVKKVKEMGNAKTSFDFQGISSDTQYNDTQRQVIKAHETLAQFYHYLLTDAPIGTKALNYLTQRGLTKETIETFNLGLSPEKAGLAYQFLLSKGFSQEIIRSTGIFLEDQPTVDRFRGRILFPLRNPMGQTIAFAGRQWQESTGQRAKYLNSPETIVFEKNRFLFNVDVAKKTRGRHYVLFEGFMDVISAYQAGLTSGVASLGTSLTNNQIMDLAHRAKQLTIAYDGDTPGIQATKRAVDHFQDVAPRYTHLHIVSFPEGKDPDDYIQAYGADAFKTFISRQRISPFAFYQNYYHQQYDTAQPDQKAQYVQAMLAVLSKQSSAIHREVQLHALAEETGLSESLLKEQLQPFKPTGRPSKRHATVAQRQRGMGWQQEQSLFPQGVSSEERAGMQLLHRLIFHPEVWHQVVTGVPQPIELANIELETIYLLLMDWYEAYPNQPINPQNFYHGLRSEAVRECFIRIVKLDLPDDYSEQEIDDLLVTIVLQSQILADNQQLTQAIAQAKSVNDFSTMNALNQRRIENLREWHQLKQKRRSLYA